jgi:predicted kinase
MPLHPSICLVILCGIPGSGKSTFAHRLETESRETVADLCVEVIEVDAVYEEAGVAGGGRSFSREGWQRAVGEAEARARQLLSDWVAKGGAGGLKYLVIDDTHYYRSMRRRYAALAISLGVGFITVYAARETEEAREANEARGEARRVPSDVFDALVAKFEEPSGAWEHWMTVEQALALGAGKLAAAHPPTRCAADEADALAAAQRTSYLSVVHEADVALRRAVAAAIGATEPGDRPAAARALADLKRRLLDQVRLGLFDDQGGDAVCDAVVAAFTADAARSR